MRTAIVFLIVFGVIVAIHEWGHYYAAKKAGVLVREFAIGMGPKIFSRKHGETTITIRLLPLGGYVRLAGRGDEVEAINAGQLVFLQTDNDGVVTLINLNTQQRKENTFPLEVRHVDIEKDMTISGMLVDSTEVTYSVSQTATLIEKNGTELLVAPLDRQLEQASVFKRMLINVAGPICNFILSIVLFSALGFIVGSVPTNSNTINVVDSGSAYSAGLRSGDVITAINGIETPSWNAIVDSLDTAKSSSQTAVTLKVKQQDQTVEMSVPFTDGAIGITQSTSDNFGDKLLHGFKQTFKVATDIFALVGNLIRQFDINQLGGPVAIASVSSQVAQQGVLSVLAFIAFLSANLGVMNLLPIPGLDGGKILLNIIEILRGKPLSEKHEMTVTLIGVGVLVLLTIAVTFNDIARIFLG